MRILCLATLVLAACSNAPDGNAAAPAIASTPAPAPTTTVAMTPVAAPARVAPRPGESRTFGDWAVACDNTLVCTMASLGAEGADFPPVTLAFTRQPGPAGGWELAIEGGEGPPIRAVAASVDGRRLALPALDGAPVAALVRAMANGSNLDLHEAGGDADRARFSLTGAAAALRWIDAQQGRAGTVTATVARGDRPAATVPARRAPPIVEALTPSGTAAAPTAAQLSAMRRQAGCDDRIVRDAGLKPEAHALGGGATLVLLPCSAGAYNLSSALFVLRDGKVAPAAVDAPTGFGPTPAAGLDRLASVVNGGWKDGELTSDAKGRGLGDCGVSQTLVWDGTRFRLSAQSMMGECRGNPHYLTIWRTQVVRR